MSISQLREMFDLDSEILNTISKFSLNDIVDDLECIFSEDQFMTFCDKGV